ncbi:MAG TPA: multicopper oxidase domain-containing protein [Candidatus Eisenbacteria bacterium]|nr:multicopper oxidase domain-containing protein [Candidatus Eisenbacteria bacterium]
MKRILASALLACLAVASSASSSSGEVTLLNPNALTKYVDALPIPGVAEQAALNYYEIGAYRIQQQLHSQLPPTTVYGYGTSEATASYPGPTIVAQKGVPISIKWTNHLTGAHILEYAFDPTLPAAHPTTGVPITTHVHGAEVEPGSDGGPNTWFTPDFAETGPDFVQEIKTYANTQLPATIWYHDHAFGYTRHNVYAGLAGYYIITDPAGEPAGLPTAPYDMGICIQDRMFTSDGQLWYPDEGETSVHPKWIPEFFGDIVLVNGKVWPYLNVEPRKYRFRFLNGAQARFFSLALSNRANSTPGPAFYQIGTDGGYLSEPVVLNDPSNQHSPRLLMAPGERCDVVIDFSTYAPGTEFLLRNTAKAPFPSGDSPDPQTVGQVMLFRVVPPTAPDMSSIPALLATVNRLSNPTVTRVMTLNEQATPEGPTGVLLNGMPYDAAVTEFPTLGTTEMWEVVNMTADTHPIHIHLVQFQLLNRQKINSRRYEMAFQAANPSLPATTYTPVDPSSYLKGKPTPADPNERGWKDTFRMNPGEVTRILVRFAPQDESPAYSFDATAAPGYVWHCHILEHEENDMMRPFYLVAPTPAMLAARSAASSPVPHETMLRAPAPNPAASPEKVAFSLATAGRVDIDLYTVTGRLVARLASDWYPAGEHAVPIPRSGNGGALSSGVYFLQLRGEGVTRSQKLVIAR